MAKTYSTFVICDIFRQSMLEYRPKLLEQTESFYCTQKKKEEQQKIKCILDFYQQKCTVFLIIMVKLKLE
jgi:hypothetical protein